MRGRRLLAEGWVLVVCNICRAGTTGSTHGSKSSHGSAQGRCNLDLHWMSICTMPRDFQGRSVTIGDAGSRFGERRKSISQNMISSCSSRKEIMVSTKLWSKSIGKLTKIQIGFAADVALFSMICPCKTLVRCSEVQELDTYLTLVLNNAKTIRAPRTLQAVPVRWQTPPFIFSPSRSRQYLSPVCA